jgi:hypothetical protein
MILRVDSLIFSRKAEKNWGNLQYPLKSYKNKYLRRFKTNSKTMKNTTLYSALNKRMWDL